MADSFSNLPENVNGFLRQFQNHVVIRVPQKRTPQKMDFLQMRLPGESLRQIWKSFVKARLI